LVAQLGGGLTPAYVTPLVFRCAGLAPTTWPFVLTDELRGVVCHVKHDGVNVLDPGDSINQAKINGQSKGMEGQGNGQSALPLPLKGGAGGNEA